MENEASPSSEELGVVNTASQWSKVSKKKPKSRTHFYWLMGGGLAVLIVFLFSSHSTPSIQSTSQHILNNDYSASLNANLARLRALNAEKSTQPTGRVTPHNESQIPTNASLSKAYLARQNAPTRMYSGPINTAAKSTSDNDIQEATFAGEGPNTHFANTNTVTSAVDAKVLPHPDFTIAAGEFLQAVLETAINSDLPGMVRAVVSKPVYSYIGERLIIPSGSRLIGQYSSAVIQGQNRVMVIWNRVVLPNGVAVQLNSPGADALGRAGQGADSVNTHFFARFGEAALLSVIGAGAATAGVDNQDQYNSAAQYRMAIAQSFQESAQQSLQGTLPMKPTLHIYQGATITVFVAHDLSFYHVLKDSPELPRPLSSFVK